MATKYINAPYIYGETDTRRMFMTTGRQESADIIYEAFCSTTTKSTQDRGRRVHVRIRGELCSVRGSIPYTGIRLLEVGARARFASSVQFFPGDFLRAY